MNRKGLNHWGVVASALAFYILTNGLAAASPNDHEKARQLQRAGEILPLETILEQARSQTSGRLLEVELERTGAGFIYEIEILDADGIVWEMLFDARSGALLETKRDD